MKVHQMLTCIFILSLQEEITGFRSVGIPVLLGIVGGTITYKCTVAISGSRKIFCKEECEEKDILVETTSDRAQRGRYSIEYKEEGGLFGVMTVSITNLTKSDLERYRCRVDSHLDQGFKIFVVDAPLMLKPTGTLPPPPTSVTSAFTPTPSAFTPTPTTSAAATGVPLYVRLTLVVIFIVSSAAVLIFCRRRASKAEDPPVEAELVNVTEADPVYDELREDRRSRSPPVEISTVYNLPCSQFAEDSV